MTTSDRYFCTRCNRELTKAETFLEPFMYMPERYTECCATKRAVGAVTAYSPVRTEKATSMTHEDRAIRWIGSLGISVIGDVGCKSLAAEFAEVRLAALEEAAKAVEATYSHEPYSTNQTFHAVAIRDLAKKEA